VQTFLKENSKSIAAIEYIFSKVKLNKNDASSSLVDKMWSAYESYDAKSNVLNGSVFEIIIACSLLRLNIKPIYVQAKVVFVPNVNFDFLLYSKNIGPLSISAKTSLRERYKQADLEAVSLKYVHRKSKAYLVTLDIEEARVLIAKLKNGDLLGIDDVIVATSSAFDKFVKELATHEFIKPVKVDIVTATNILEIAI
jgi:hypothetical protein